MHPTLEGGIAALRRRRWFQGWLARAGAHLSVALYAAGGAVLVLRALARWERAAAAPLLALAALGLVTAALAARRTRPGRTAAAAWLDVYGGARGQVVTESELGASAWSAEAGAQLTRALAALPRADAWRAWRPALPAALFAALCVLVPIPRGRVGPPAVLTDAAVAELGAKLATLEEVLELAPETAEELAARLERVAAEAAGGEPASTFEAIDRLDERLEAEAQAALAAAQHAGEDLARAAGDPDLGAAQHALESALSSLDAAGLARTLPAALENALLPGSLSLPEGVQLSSAELAAFARELDVALGQRLSELAAGRLLDPSALREWKEGAGGLGSLAELDPDHECDEACKQPGGT